MFVNDLNNLCPVYNDPDPDDFSVLYDPDPDGFTVLYDPDLDQYSNPDSNIKSAFDTKINIYNTNQQQPHSALGSAKLLLVLIVN